MDDLNKQLAVNLAFLLWQKNIAREEWPEQLAMLIHSDYQSAQNLLSGKAPTLDEMDQIIEFSGFSEEDLRYSSLFQQVPVFMENLKYLLATLPHGSMREFADFLDVDQSTLSRWRNGKQNPAGKYHDMIKEYFQLSSNIDLKESPLFLSLIPIGEIAQKNWLHEKIDALDAEILKELFPALKKLLD